MVRHFQFTFPIARLSFGCTPVLVSPSPSPQPRSRSTRSMWALRPGSASVTYDHDDWRGYVHGSATGRVQFGTRGDRLPQKFREPFRSTAVHGSETLDGLVFDVCCRVSNLGHPRLQQVPTDIVELRGLSLIAGLRKPLATCPEKTPKKPMPAIMSHPLFCCPPRGGSLCTTSRGRSSGSRPPVLDILNRPAPRSVRESKSLGDPRLDRSERAL